MRSRMNPTRDSRGQRTLLPNITTGISRCCMSLYALARETPSSSATSAPRSKSDSLSDCRSRLICSPVTLLTSIVYHAIILFDGSLDVGKMIITSESIRPKLNTQLTKDGHRPISESEWKHAIDNGWLVGVCEGTKPLNDLVLEITQTRKNFGGAKSARVKAELTAPVERGASGARKHALSVLVALEAEKDSGVIELRNELLGGKLLEQPEIEGWIRKIAVSEPEPTGVATVELPDDAIVKPGQIEVNGVMACRNVSCDVLHFPDRNGTEVQKVGISARGKLAPLFRVSAQLAKQYRWRDVDAVAFILSGAVPLIEPAGCSFKRHESLPCLSRITLEVDIALSPAQVGMLYQKLRSRLLEGRYRNQTPKHAMLAAFTAQRDELTLEEQRRDWNKRYPRWRYQVVTNFGRDAKAARDRLLRPSNLDLEAMLKAEGAAENGKTKTRKR